MKKSLDGRDVYKTYQKAEILQKNFRIFEVTLKEGGSLTIKRPGEEAVEKVVKEKTEFQGFFDEAIPPSVRRDTGSAIFLVLIEPEAGLQQRGWIEEELRKMKVIYGIQAFPKE